MQAKQKALIPQVCSFPFQCQWGRFLKCKGKETKKWFSEANVMTLRLSSMYISKRFGHKTTKAAPHITFCLSMYIFWISNCHDCKECRLCNPEELSCDLPATVGSLHCHSQILTHPYTLVAYYQEKVLAYIRMSTLSWSKNLILSKPFQKYNTSFRGKPTNDTKHHRMYKIYW